MKWKQLNWRKKNHKRKKKWIKKIEKQKWKIIFRFSCTFLSTKHINTKLKPSFEQTANPKVSFSSSHRLFLFLYLTNLPSSLGNPKLSLYNPHLNPPMAKAQIGLHSQSLYSLPIFVSHPLSLDLFMVQN